MGDEYGTTSCGLSTWRPKWLQRFASRQVFTILSKSLQLEYMRRAMKWCRAQLFIFQATAGCSIVVLIPHNLQKIKNNSKAWIQPSGVHRHLLLAWDCSRNGLLLPLRRPIHHREAVWNSVEGLGNMQNSDEDVFCLRKLPGCFLATRSVKSVSSSLFPSSVRFTEGPSGPRWR